MGVAPRDHHLIDRPWTDVAATGGAALVVVPVGSVEQHGPHLPLDTDTRIACELSTRLVAALAREHGGDRAPALLGPPVAYGASGEHADFPGTLSIGTNVLEALLVELVRSARRSFGAVMFVSGHGGNAEALERAVRRCREEGDRVGARGAAFAGGDAHAGRTETSIMLAISPTLVRLGELAPGCVEPLGAILPRLRASGVRSVSPNGVLGDPRGATALEGRRLLSGATLQLLPGARALLAATEAGFGERRDVASTSLGR
jgi:mycofactocin precursor peptide peptidase